MISVFQRFSVSAFAALAALWLPIIYLLSAQWSIYEQYNYGWAVPFLCAYLLYRRWRSTSPPSTDHRSLISNLAPPSVPGSAGDSPAGFGASPKPLPLSASQDFSISDSPSAPSTLNPQPSTISAFELFRMAFSPSRVSRTCFPISAFQLFSFSAFCFLLLPTRILQEANPLWRFASYALVGEAIIITLALIYFAGGSRALRHFAFPVCFFLVAVPWPTPVELAIVQSLTTLNTASVVELMGLFGIPAVAHGNVIEISTGMLGVDEACSGIRSTQAVFMLALFFGEFFRLCMRGRIGLLASGLLIALLLNIVRTSILVTLAARGGIALSEKWHDATGITVLLGCFTLVWLLSARMVKAESGKQNEEMATQSPLSIGSSTLDVRSSMFDPKPETPNPKPTPPNSESGPPSTTPPSSGKLSFSAFQLFSFLILAFSLLSVVGSELWFRTHEKTHARNEQWTTTLPQGSRGFREIVLSPSTRAQLQCDFAATGAWPADDGSFWQFFHFRWSPGNSLKDRVRVHLAKSHRPEHCLPGSGWILRRRISPIVLDINGVPVAFRVYDFEIKGRTVFVFFAVHEDGTSGREIGNFRESHRMRFKAAWEGNRGLGQRVIEVAISGARDLAQAEASLRSELPKLVHLAPAP